MFRFTIFQWLVKLYWLAGLVQLQPIRTSSGPSLAHHLHLGPNKTFLLHSYLVIFELALESLEYTDTGFYLLFNVEYTIHPSLMSLLTCRHVEYGRSRIFFLLQKRRPHKNGRNSGNLKKWMCFHLEHDWGFCSLRPLNTSARQAVIRCGAGLRLENKYTFKEILLRKSCHSVIDPPT